MKKNYKPFYFSLVVAGLLNSQPIINATDFNPSVGESFTNNSVSYQDPGVSGANVTWDFSNLVSSSTSTINYLAANTNFPATNINQSTNGTANQYIEMTNTAWNIHGVLGSGVTISYQDPMQFMSFPMTFGASHTDEFAASFVSGGYAFNRSGFTSSEVDGFGTLITPEGTFTDVLRVHYTQDYSDISDLLGESAYLVHIYAWYKVGFHSEIASFSTIDTDFGSSSFGIYLETTGLGLTEEEKSQTLIFPNPTSNHFSITLNNTNSLNSNVKVLDLNGKHVDIKLEVKDNKIYCTLDALKVGVYFVQVTNEEFTETHKLIVE